MKRNKKILTASVALSVMFSFAVAGVVPAKAATGFNSQGADLGELFVLDNLFRNAGNSNVLSGGDTTNLGNLFILNKLFNADTTSAAVAVVPSVADRVAGKIVIQVEANGEAWYVSPTTKQRTYLNGANTAYKVMGEMSTGISNADFNAINTGNAADVPARVVGKFLLKVEDKGKLYYVNPTDKKIIMVSSPADATNVIKTTGLGISNSDINKITVAK
jgi:hypothetical protein